ncbi:MAG TPA: hypothetical protein VM871_11010, partial [Flavisolibacter sp.]|nr:hypothetical protein [Flavisolibacter sp.]
FFNRLVTNYQGVQDLPYLLSLLEEAGKTTSEKLVQKRLVAFKSYLHYLVLYYRQAQAPEIEALKADLYDYVLQTHHYGMVHGTRIAELLYNQLPAGSRFRNEWLFANSTGRASSLKALDDGKIEALFQDDRRRYPLMRGTEPVAKKAPVETALKKVLPVKEPAGEGMLVGDWPETYVRPSQKGEVIFFVKVNIGSKNNDSQRYALQLINVDSGNIVAEKTIGINRYWQQVRLAAPAQKTYKLISKHTSWIRLAVPESQWLAFKNIPTYAVMGRLWFYNEPGSLRLYYNNTAKDQPVFMDERGNTRLPEKINDLNTYQVNLSGGSGQWWSIDGTEYKFLQFHSPSILFFPHGNVQAKSNN